MCLPVKYVRPSPAEQKLLSTVRSWLWNNFDTTGLWPNAGKRPYELDQPRCQIHTQVHQMDSTDLRVTQTTITRFYYYVPTICVKLSDHGPMTRLNHLTQMTHAVVKVAAIQASGWPALRGPPLAMQWSTLKAGRG